MNCRNCGAPMEPFVQRGYHFCRFCGTFEFLDVPAVDGVQLLEPEEGRTPCPLCNAPLRKSLLDGSWHVQHCERCRGTLMGTGAFADAVERRRARQGGTVPPVPFDSRELDRHVTCPACHKPMDVHPYYGPGNVVIDSCSGCNLVWLDFGELKQITEAPGLKAPNPWGLEGG